VLLGVYFYRRLIVHCRVPRRLLEARLPSPWEPLDGPYGNLSVGFCRVLRARSGDDGAATRDNVYASFTGHALDPVSGRRVNMFYRTYAVRPDELTGWSVSRATPARRCSASFAIGERSRRGGRRTESYAFAPDGGGSLALEIAYRPGRRFRERWEAEARCADDPGFALLFENEDVHEPLRDALHDWDGVDDVRLRVLVPEFEQAFAASSEIVAVSLMPSSRRRVYALP
jgi:hypothetical protein